LNITKIKFNKGKVEIEYEKNDRETDSKKTQFSSYDEPLPGFTDALQALSLHAEEICEFPEGFLTAPAAFGEDGEVVEQKGTVSGVSFSYSDKEGIMGATITVLRKLATAQAPLVINTPHLPEAPYSEGSCSPLLSSGCVRALNHLQDEALKYLAGDRAEKQQELIETGTKTVPITKALAKDVKAIVAPLVRDPGSSLKISYGDEEVLSISHEEALQINQNANQVMRQA
jgi:hypothetical protein